MFSDYINTLIALVGNRHVRKSRRLWGGLLVSLLGYITLGVDPIALCVDWPDPYAILQRSYEVAGSLDSSAMTTSYGISTFSVETAGVLGYVREWRKYPTYWRREAVFNGLMRLGGDDGTIMWESVSPGKIDTIRDSARLAERMLDSLLAEQEELNRESKIFKVAYLGLDSVGEFICYVVSVTNTVTGSVVDHYIDTTACLERKLVETRDGEENLLLLSDYRAVGTYLVSFREDGRYGTNGPTMTILTVKFVPNVPLPDSIFRPSIDSLKGWTY